MKFLNIVYLFLFLFVASSGAFAQTFAPGSAPAAANSSSSALTKKTSNVQESDDDFNEEDFEFEDFEDDSAEKSDFLTDAVKNFDAEDDDKYDNSIGKVFEIRYVDGKVVISENKDRKILVYYDDYKLEKGLDGIVRCSMRIYVLNDLEEKISDFSFKLKWPKIGTSIQMNHLNPGVRTYSDIMLLGDGCYSMDKIPTIEINRCRVKGKTQEKCADAVKWYDK